MSQDYTNKLHAGSTFPKKTATLKSGEEVVLGAPRAGFDWQLIVVYRGKHCPLCTKYLNQLQNHIESLAKIGVDVIAISGDSKEQLITHTSQLNTEFDIAYGMTLEQMKEFGLYISDPRSDLETDHPFAEPGLFVVNEQGNIQVIDISNNPFVRPELEALVSGLTWIKDPDNNYPIRGMHR
ncbi:redoxin domain-containing protein [Pseudoalteromonas luteoviolacea]|uniref:Thioredoxin domain-containing protein n=1 Tax=Pseudoalteromonas luteoviolacea S4054 TaxID=1129367 RepID=A0A0F6AIX0_9GAMM|nr:redoxin domain-containing protein [Pseudoalteromonas luteoviolacea]AOT07877.1 thioredoxin peroxidase [Pseudoalteromonas luteoviolacea]AOT12793.1 thioredoxin peroxidase [Pseudoalteromonas luteoviolacea]AOT17706.1 thioredoxin peroxidase [Pseudoalteromonas luteoviolacea]KKE85884.1 hypothetical protein N479_00490 [Pseudoalteromonas luteoviolacea S4054]KZN74762.1 hypothetical protein N481_08870 [Pseudoalteromonas luteoviolacea S4047-1]